MDPSRERALEVLLEWERGRGSLDLIFQRLVEGDEHLDRQKKAFSRELVFGTVRWLSRIDWTLYRLYGKPLKVLKPVLRNALRIGAYQLTFLDRVPPWAAVHETVQLVKEREGKKGAGFVNAILRNLLRERDSLVPDSRDPIERLSLLWAFPRWLVRRFYFQFGPEETEALLGALNAVAPFTIRTNSLRTSRDKLMRTLEPFSPRPTSHSPWGIRLEEPRGVLEAEAFREGLFQVQDEGAQLVSWLLSPRGGERVLDLCAAPGGKSTHLAELMGNRGEILAVDVNPSRLRWLEENCRRLGIRIIRPMRRDATKPLPCGEFDKVLVDVPCSGLGVIRRNPDIKWRLSPKEIRRLAEIQGRILRVGASALRRGGYLLYSTCTLTPEENERVVQGLVQEGGFELVDLRGRVPIRDDFFTPEGYFMSLPWRHGTDGFFCALLRKL